MKNTYFTLFAVLVFILSGCSGNEQKKTGDKQSGKKAELTVSAAASLQDALNEIASEYEKNHHVKINYNFGASGALMQQISQGAPVDLFFSAAEDKFDQLVKEGLIEKKQSKDLVSNELVLVIPSDSKAGIRSFEDLIKAGKISIGTPDSVPAGHYAVETLNHLNLKKKLDKKLIYAKDVRQVLTYVETGNVDAGIVYKTDAMVSKKVKIAAVADESTHEPIIYPAGIIKNSNHTHETKEFYQFLQSPKAMKTFEKYGFKGVK